MLINCILTPLLIVQTHRVNNGRERVKKVPKSRAQLLELLKGKEGHLRRKLNVYKFGEQVKPPPHTHAVICKLQLA